MKILIATDGSEFSEAAVETICQTVKTAENVEVKIVSAYEPAIMVAAAPYAVYAAENPAVEKEMRELATQSVARRTKNPRAFSGFAGKSFDAHFMRLARTEHRRRSRRLGRGFNRRRLARLRFLGANVSRLGFERRRSARALFGDGRAETEKTQRQYLLKR